MCPLTREHQSEAGGWFPPRMGYRYRSQLGFPFQVGVSLQLGICLQLGFSLQLRFPYPTRGFLPTQVSLSSSVSHSDSDSSDSSFLSSSGSLSSPASLSDSALHFTFDCRLQFRLGFRFRFFRYRHHKLLPEFFIQDITHLFEEAPR